MNTIGERIKWLRKERCKMTQEMVGRYIGVGKATIQKYENGIISNIPSDKIVLLAEILETTPAFIMGWSENPERFVKNPALPGYGYDPNGNPNERDLENAKLNSEIIQLLSSLSDEGRKQAMDYLRFLATRGDKK